MTPTRPNPPSGGNDEPPTSFGEGRYQILSLLGTGAFGVVYRVFDTKLGHEVALKTISRPSPDLRVWLKEEYRALWDIAHPNLVGLRHLHVEGARCFFTMDIVQEGQPFTHRLDFDRRGPEDAQRAAIRKICRAGFQLADALRAVHEFRKCHRDVKPSNVLVTPQNKVVLLDFGIAGLVDRSVLLDTLRGVLVGTLPYIAPEQYDEPRPLEASDWYSAGVMLYETIVGQRPFTDDHKKEREAKRRLPPAPSLTVPAIPEAAERLILGLLAPAMEDRPSAEEVCARLREMGDEPGARVYWSSHRAEVQRDFVARDGEIATLQRAYVGAIEGRFATAEIVGPSGIGKTALIRHFLGTLRGGGAAAPLVLEARCHPHESIPYKAFDAVVDDLARYWMGLDESIAVSLCPSEGIEALALLFPALLRVPRLASRVSGADLRGDPRALRQSGFGALQQVLCKLCEIRPVVLWVDDLHWADADSVALLESVFGGEGAPPVALLLSRRPDEETVQPALRGAIAQAQQRGTSYRLDLGPLGAESAQYLARSIAEHEGAVSAGTIEAIVDAAAGLPYLVFELAHFAAERSALEGESSLVATAGSLMRARIGTLSPEDRALLELSALSGAAQPSSVLMDAAGTKDRSRFRDLCVMRLLRWTGEDDHEVVQIYHDRLRDFIVGALDPQTKVKHHRSLLSVLEASRSPDAEQLMDHALAAGERARAHTHARAAAERAEAALAFAQAARLYAVALEQAEASAPRAALHALLAEAKANAGLSTDAAPEFERALAAVEREAPWEIERRGFLRRRAGEQYLKAGHFNDGLRLMEAFLADAKVALPRSGKGALAVSARRRVQLYLRGFEFQPRASAEIAPQVRSRLDDLWAATTALSMMDPVRADGVGLLHFLEALEAGETSHVARSLGYEAAFAALIGTHRLRKKAKELLERNRLWLGAGSGPYERAFHELGAGSSAFFHSDWDEAVRACDAAAQGFRSECRGAEYEAAVAMVFSLQALGQSGRVAELVKRIPAAIREADARGDLFAANNYRGGFHALGRIAAGQIGEVQADVQKVVKTWKPGFYQMHAYHRVFAGVAADLYVEDPASAVARIEEDWPELEAGLFLWMELPATELRWTRARAALALASRRGGQERRRLLHQVESLTGKIERATIRAATSHAASLRAGIAAVEGRTDAVIPQLRKALHGYGAAGMAIHREVARWHLGRLIGGSAGQPLLAEVTAWTEREGVPEMAPLARAIAPGLELGA